MDFFGAEAELKIIRDCTAKKPNILIVIYGRRRIDKTRLITECFKNDNLTVLLRPSDFPSGQDLHGQLRCHGGSQNFTPWLNSL